MDDNNLILIEHFCTNCDIDDSFLTSLNEYGLVEIIIIEDRSYIHKEHVKSVEKMVSFHYDLNINLEGIDAISNLLKQIDTLQEELDKTKNKLRFYEED
jgi:hypothetical protein